MTPREDPGEDDLVREIDSIYEGARPSDRLPGRVQRGVLLASVVRAVVQLYLSSVTVVARSLAEAFGAGRGPGDRDRESGKE